MPIRWSALEVDRAMSEVEAQYNLASSFLAEAEAKAEEARKIAHLPQYMTQSLARLVYTIERCSMVKDSVNTIRSAIPDGAVEAEREQAKYSQQGLAM
ncbi:unnamed protein product [marine sediment metagenome]|uniref:Uncharacterized protein n=1 Tax=marine sediment metagenome TaxID=412755 RepID=X1T883_9ZZZZ